MNYTAGYYDLKNQFDLSESTIRFSDSDISCHKFRFDSTFKFDIPFSNNKGLGNTNAILHYHDNDISENKSFIYTVFVPGTVTRFDKAILLLHGLNERNWLKYLMWAYHLAEHTKRPVILFPIAFHINRSPEEWSNPRVINNCLTDRREHFGQEALSSLANLALSERLSESPGRFVTSGLQSAQDITMLISNIQAGRHPLFFAGSSVDIFAYSIGAFLAQILILSNQDDLYSDTRLFIFCGGALFDQMNGTSKLIMDKGAFDRLRHFYIDELEGVLQRNPILKKFFNETQLGVAFTTMLAKHSLQKYRENAFERMRDRIEVVALANDKVIPARGAMEAFGPHANIEVMDFPFDYSHEVPFPLMKDESSKTVDQCFETVFSKAASFFR